jgi:hypothetical protein
MKYKILIIGLFVVLSSASVSARETETQIGKWQTYSGSIKFSVVDKDGSKRAVLFISDKHVIETNYFSVNKADLEKIRALIDKTIQELESGSNK